MARRHQHRWGPWERATGSYYPGVEFRDCRCDGSCPQSEDKTVLRWGDPEQGWSTVYRFVYDADRDKLTERQLVGEPEFGAQIGNVQGGWRETTKFKDKKGNWVTRTVWGSGKAGW